MTTTEPEFDDQELAWARALAQFESELCPLCGFHKSICTDPALEGHVKVPPPTRCHVSTALSRARDPYRKTERREALMFVPVLPPR